MEFSRNISKEDEKVNLLKREVCEIFNIMGFESEPLGICTANENDFFIIKKKKSIGSKNEYYLCSVFINGNDTDEINAVTKINTLRQFLESTLLTRNEARYCEALVISPTSMTSQTKKVANSFNVLLYTYNQLLSELMDFRKYLTKIRTNFLPNINEDQYIGQNFWYEKEKKKINTFEFIDRWLESSESKTLLILGDPGTGKSALVRNLTYNLVESYNKNLGKAKIPYLINLKSDGEIMNFQNFLYNHLRKNEVEPANTNRFFELLSCGKILLIFDSLDIIINKLGAQIVHEFISQLNQNLKGEAKVIFTLSTSSFKDNEEIEFVFGMPMAKSIFGKYEDYYLDIFEIPPYEIVYLERFSIPQIESYLNKNMHDNWKQFFQIIQKRYDFIDLASRPMFLKILVKEFLKNASKGTSKVEKDIYGLICIWLENEKTKGFFLSGEIGAIIEELAYKLVSKRQNGIPYEDLFEFIMEYLKKNKLLDIKLNVADAEVRASGFLVRDENDNYNFAHKSLQEFLVAQKIIRELDLLNFDILDMELLSEGTIFFLQQMMNEQNLLRIVNEIISEKSYSGIFNNALYIYYLIQRNRILRLNISSVNYVVISSEEIKNFWEKVTADISEKINIDIRDTYLEKWKSVSPIERRNN